METKPVNINKGLFATPNGSNVIGLRSGQAALYEYIVKCQKENKSINSDGVANIYYTRVKEPNSNFGIYGWYYSNWPADHPLKLLKNKDATAFFNSDSELAKKHRWMFTTNMKMWFKTSMGSLVVRGLLNVIPTIDTDLLEK